MKRRNFIKNCCCVAVGASLTSALLQSCAGIYYATFSSKANEVRVAKTQFQYQKKEKVIQRKFVLLKLPSYGFPICLYQLSDDVYSASLLKCTHRGCELNVGGGIYTCPCHGSEFSNTGKVLEGPANQDLQTFQTKHDHENIYIYLS